MQNAPVSNPKDDIVVSFHNNTEFGFTPDMGCMYDGRPINGATGAPGIDAGEKKMLPYHIGWRLARNLAKRVFNTSPAATVDPQGIPTGVAVWNPDKLEELAKTFIHEEYSDAKPVAQSETDKLMAKVAELEKFVNEKLNTKAEVTEQPKVVEEALSQPKVYLDKQEVIAELDKRGIKYDKRQNKDNLQKLLD